MINFRIIARAYSILLIVEGLFMLVSAGVSLIYQEHTATSFLFSALITIVTGVLVFTPLRNEEKIFGNKEGYIIITGIWLIFSLFGTYHFSSAVLYRALEMPFLNQCRVLPLQEQQYFPMLNQCHMG